MARRFRHSDNDRSATSVTTVTDRASEQVPLPGFIQLKPGRNRHGNKTWRTPGLDGMDMGDGAASDFEADASSSPMGLLDALPTSTKRVQRRLTPFDLPAIKTSLVGRDISQTPISMNQSYETEMAPQSAADEDISPTDTRFNVDVMENYRRVFGRLPDLIHLHEKLGDFDGEVAFIGHPNRDISAHQWSTAIFQWVTVGTWSQTRRKVEGSLAADRVPPTHFQPHTIEWFKFAAEHREAMIKRFGRTEEETENAVDGMQNSLTNAETKALQPTFSASPAPTFTMLRPNVPLPRHASVPASVPASSHTITREHLEDPFVTPAKPQQPAIPTALNFRNSVGAMDLSYQFSHTPKDNTGSYEVHHSYTDPQQPYVQPERLSFLHHETKSPAPASEAPSYLGEIGFGEEAASSFSTPVARSHPNLFLSPENSLVRQQLKNKLSELGSQPRRSTAPAERKVAMPDTPIQSPGIRALFPPGPTVANPHRGIISTLNANAPPYNRMSSVARPSDASESEVTSSLHPDPRLQFSDPDGNRPGQVHEVANGLDKQTPTPQQFSGPFFADTMPTTHNPVASLAVPLSEEEKLMSWFSDGQNPARQQGFAKTLIATARAGNKTRNLGAIGEKFPQEQDDTLYENTRIFARVYENLLQYAEDSCAGKSSNYFTRAWKPAPLYLRDLVPEGNNSFFDDTSGLSPLVFGNMLKHQTASGPWLKLGSGPSSKRPSPGRW